MSLPLVVSSDLSCFRAKVYIDSRVCNNLRNKSQDIKLMKPSGTIDCTPKLGKDL